MSLSITQITPGLTGTALIEAIGNSKNGRKAIAEGFIYEQTLMMLFSDPGIGKSTILTQMAVELSSGIPIFGVFHVPIPVKVLYAQTERSVLEFLERLELIGKTYPINTENLMVTDEFQKLNMLNPDHVRIMIESIKRDFPDVKVTCFDPIYPMVSGGLKNDEPASAFTHAMSLVQKELGCTNIYTHHTVKEQFEGGNAIHKDDKSYGSRWIKAHITGSYEITSSKDDKGVILTRKKDNYGLLPHVIRLEYSHETGLCSIPQDEMPAIEKIRNFGIIQYRAGKRFDMHDMIKGTELCREVITRILCHSSLRGQFIVVSNKNNKHIYEYKPSQ